MEEKEYLICSCCGHGVENTPEDNVDYGKNLADQGYGHCKACFGYPDLPELEIIPGEPEDTTEQKARRRMGWALSTFYDARISMLLEKLNTINRKKFSSLPYIKKCSVVAEMVKKGYII